MHVLLIPSWYKTTKNPIRGNFFRNEGLALHKVGHKVGMIVPPSKFRTWNGLSELRANWRKSNEDVTITHDEGLLTYRIPWWGWLPSVMPLMRGELALRIFDRYCAENGRPDVIHGQAILYGGYLAAYIGQKRDIPVVLTEYASIYLSGNVFAGQKRIVEYTLRHSGKRLAIAPSLVDALKPYTPELPIELVGCIVDTDSFTANPLNTQQKPFVFCMVASLTPRKAHDVLLKAFAQAFRGQDVIVRIAGTGYKGKKLDELKNLIAELGIGTQVELLGMISQDDLRALMQQSHALVSSSHIETFGVTVIEAMACGKPVVATRSGGPEYFVSENSGILAPVNDPPALAKAMQELVQNYARYDAETIRAECIAQFGEQAIVKRLEDVYRDVGVG